MQSQIDRCAAMPETNLPGIEYLRGHTTPPSTGHTTTPTFGMIPLEISADPSLSHRDVRVFNILASHRRGPFVSIGERRIGKMIRIDRRGVRDSIAKLVKTAHVEALTSKHGGRARYRLTSELFGGKAKPAAQAVPSCHQPEKPDLLPICPKCRKSCRQLLKVGYCRSCRWDAKVRRITREEIARTA